MSPSDEKPGRVGPLIDTPVEDPAGSAADKIRKELLTKCQDPAVRAAQEAKCRADTADDQKTFNDLKTDFDALSKASYDHNLGVSSYDQQLQTFQTELVGFQADLIAYMQDLAGRTYT